MNTFNFQFIKIVSTWAYIVLKVHILTKRIYIYLEGIVGATWSQFQSSAADWI